VTPAEGEGLMTTPQPLTPAQIAECKKLGIWRLNLSRHPILRSIYDVAQAIEACGASEQLTRAVTLAGQLSEQAATILDERDEALADAPRFTRRCGGG